MNGEMANLPADAVTEWTLEAALNQKPRQDQQSVQSVAQGRSADGCCALDKDVSDALIG